MDQAYPIAHGARRNRTRKAGTCPRPRGVCGGQAATRSHRRGCTTARAESIAICALGRESEAGPQTVTVELCAPGAWSSSLLRTMLIYGAAQYQRSFLAGPRAT